MEDIQRYENISAVKSNYFYKYAEKENYNGKIRSRLLFFKKNQLCDNRRESGSYSKSDPVPVHIR